MIRKTTITLLACGMVMTTVVAQEASEGSSALISSSARPVDFTVAAENTINGVVSIKSFATPRGYGYNGYDEMFNDPFFEFFFGQGQRRGQRNRQPEQSEQRQTGLGSGVIISEDGYIVTNNHVIEGAERLEITLNDSRTFNATVIGTDPVTDLALIKIDATNLHTIPFGDSDALKVGEWVLAVGNPYAFTSTVTAGIVSAKARNISQITQSRSSMGIESYIQTDAAVNPGNSGGALVNLNGELVGINTAIISPTGAYSGYSFAIPTSIVSKIITDIRQYGAVQRAVLGIGYVELTPQLAHKEGISIVNDGIYVARVEDRSAAMEAGLQEGDVIIGIGDATIHNTAQLQETLNRYRPGDKVKITYVRDNKKQMVEVTLRNNQGSTSITSPDDVLELGCAFTEVPAETLRQLGLRSGVQVSGLRDGKFKTAGIPDGFIIVEINGNRVGSKEDVEQIYNAIMQSNTSNKVMFITGVYPTGKVDYFAVKLTE